MQGCPALAVAAVDVGALLHKKLHHVQVIVDAGLQKDTQVRITLYSLRETLIYNPGRLFPYIITAPNCIIELLRQLRVRTSHQQIGPGLLAKSQRLLKKR